MHSLRLRYVLFIGFLPLGCGIALAFSKTLTSYLLIILGSTCVGGMLAHHLYKLHMSHSLYALEQFQLILNGDFMPTPPKDKLFREDKLLLQRLDESSLRVRMSINSICKEIESLSAGNIPINISTQLSGDYQQISESLNKLCFSLKTDKVKFHCKTKKLEDNAKNTYICSQKVHKAYTQQLKVAKDMLRCLALTQDSFNLCKNYSEALDLKMSRQQELLKNIEQLCSNEFLLLQVFNEINNNSWELCNLVKQVSDLNNNLALITAVEASNDGASPSYTSLVAKQSHTLAVKNMYVLKEMEHLKTLIGSTLTKHEKALNCLNESAVELKELSNSKNHILSEFLEQTSICSKETDSCAKNALSLIKSLESNSKQTQTDIVHVSEGISNIATEIKETAPYLLKPQPINANNNLLSWVKENDK